MKRDKRFHLKLTDEERAALEAKADQLGTKMSVLARIALRREIGLPTAADLLAF